MQLHSLSDLDNNSLPGTADTFWINIKSTVVALYYEQTFRFTFLNIHHPINSST